MKKDEHDILRHLRLRFLGPAMMPVQNENKAISASVLILALWTVFFLAALTIAVSAIVSANLTLAGRLKDGVTARYLAKAGIERAIMEIVSDTNSWDGLTESWSNNGKLFKDYPVKEGVFSIIYRVSLSRSGGDTLCYGVIDEERKININKADKELLEMSLEVLGGLTQMEASDIAASIMDWRDEDDEILTGGAENRYYAGLKSAYTCHNGSFGSIYELLLVKGVKGELFSKIARHITVYGTGKVNINTADAVVLRVLAGWRDMESRNIVESLIDKIVKFREAGNTFVQPKASAIVGQLNEFVRLESSEQTILLGMIKNITISSTCFSGFAEAKLAGANTPGKFMEFVFDRNRQEILYWHER